MGGLEAAAADLADDESRHPVGQAGLDDGLAGRVLAIAGGQYLAEDHFIDTGRVEADLGQQALDDLGAQFGRRDLGQATSKFADCGTARGDDDDFFHLLLQLQAGMAQG